MVKMTVAARDTTPDGIKNQMNYLVSPKISERFFKLYQKGTALRVIAKKCAVSVRAIKTAFPDLDFSNRGSIKHFNNRNPNDMGKHNRYLNRKPSEDNEKGGCNQ